MFLVIVDPHNALFAYLAAAHRKGFRPLVLSPDVAHTRLDERRHAQAAQHRNATHLDEIVECDVDSPAAIVAALRPYRDRIAGMVAGNETSVTPTFEAGSALGLDCARPADARCQHVKTAMKQRLVDRGVPTPAFYPARTFTDAERAWQAFGGDCIVKMVDYRSSANVYRVASDADLRNAWEMITTNGLGLDTPFSLAREAIVEAFVDGREVTAEGYTTGDRIEFLNFCEKGTSDRFVVVDHFVPARLTPAEQAAVEDVSQRCVRALGIRNNVFHVELNVVDGQPYVIECAARPPGSTEVLDMIRWARGADLIDISIDLSTGRPVTARYRPAAHHYALLSLYASRSGRLTGLTGLVELRRKGGVRRWHLAAKLGDRVEALEDFRQQYGSLILEGATAQAVRDAAHWARANLRLLVEPDGPGLSGERELGRRQPTEPLPGDARRPGIGGGQPQP
jgi:biotin carboxylase